MQNYDIGHKSKKEEEKVDDQKNNRNFMEMKKLIAA